MNHRLLRLLIALGSAVLCFGCQRLPPHPPTFTDFRRVGPGALEDEKKLNAQVAVFEAAQFRRRELEHIQSRGIARELVGSATTLHVGDTNIPALTREAWLRGSNDPVTLAGIAQALIREFNNSVSWSGRDQELEQALAALERADQRNGLPFCLRAYFDVVFKKSESAAVDHLEAMLNSPAKHE